MVHQINFTVFEKKLLTHNVFELVIRPSQAHSVRPDFIAGQWISIVIPASYTPQKKGPIRRAYSIASPPEEGAITLSIQRIEKGPGTNYLFSLEKGDTIDTYCYYGHLTYTPRHNNIVFIATGTGIAPFRSILLSSHFKEHKPKGTTMVLIGFRHESDILYEEELHRHTSHNTIICLSQPKDASKRYYAGRLTQYLQDELKKPLSERHLPPLHETDFYLCGNGAMISEVKTLLVSCGVPTTSIQQEIYFKPSKESSQSSSMDKRELETI